MRKTLLMLSIALCTFQISAMEIRHKSERRKNASSSLMKSCNAAIMAYLLMATPTAAYQCDPYHPVIATSCNLKDRLMTDKEQQSSLCFWDHKWQKNTDMVNLLETQCFVSPCNEYDEEYNNAVHQEHDAWINALLEEDSERAISSAGEHSGFKSAIKYDYQPRQCSPILIRYLTPPRLSKATILEEVVCHRPRRIDAAGAQAPRIEREVINGTTVIHDFGHSSGGWTMAWGAAQEAVDLLQPADSKDIAIVGGGVSGLAAAYSLIKAGIIPNAIIAREFENLTSHNAGGLFAHQSSNPNDETRNKVNGWIITSLPKYRAIAEGKIPEFKGCARMVPAYFADRATSDLEESVKAGVLSPAKDVIVDFQNGMRKSMVVYDDNIFIDTYCMMAKLRAYLEKKGVPFIQKEVSDLSSLPYGTVFNCAGLGGTALAGEDPKSMIPVQGHLLLLKGQKDAPEYTIEVELGNGKTEEDKHVSYYMYYFFKRKPDAKDDEVGILGGTSIKIMGTEEPNHPARFARVLQNAQEYFGNAK